MSGIEILSIVINIGLAIWGIVQLVNASKEEEKVRSKVRIWHKHIEGIKNALLQIGQNPNSYSDKTDIASAVQAVAQSAVSLDDAFAEERFYKDEEIKVRREAKEKEIQTIFKKFRRAQPQV